MEDLRTLAEIRHGGTVPFCDDGGGKVGPDLFGHIGAVHLARVIPYPVLWPEIQQWARIILPASYVNSPAFPRHCSTLLHQAKQAVDGQTIQHHGKAVTPIYRYSPATIIERLEITGDEMRHMTRLIDKDEKRRRDRDKWREEHTGQTREEYDSGRGLSVDIKRGQAQELKARGMTNLAISYELNVSEMWVSRLLSGKN